MTIAAVGTQEGGVNSDNQTFASRTFGSDVTAGNLVVVVALKYSPSLDAFVAGDCTQTAGTATLGTINFDTSVNFAYDAGAAHVAVGIWSAIVTGSGSCTMDVAGGVAGSYWNLATGEYSASGGWDSARLDGTPVTNTNATDNSSPATTGNMTSTGGGLFIAGVSIGGGGGTVTITEDGAFTLIFEEQDSATHNIGSAIRQIVTGSTTDQGEWTLGTGHVGWAAAMVVYKEAAPASTRDQEGFRWGADDGDEAGHSFLAAQDTDITQPLNQNVLLRILVDAAGDPPSTAYTLRYQKNGSGGYVPVPVGASSKTTPVIESGDATVTTVGTASATWAINMPAAVSGDLLIAILAWDDSTTVTGVTAPTGPNTEAPTAILGSPVASNGTEMRMQAWWWKATGSWSATTRTFTPSASETVRAVVIKVPAGEFDGTTAIGASSSSASAGTAETAIVSPAFSAGASDGGGRLIIAYGSDADAITAPASGTDTVNNATGGGVGLCVVGRTTAVSDSESIASINATIAGDSWASLAFVVRAPTVTNELYVATSANIAAGGEDTTARLTPPSGKTTSDFTTGRRWDDENGTDTIDIAEDFYTELEWCLQAQSPATTSDFFEFRIYAGTNPLDSYGTTPKWTIGTPGGGGDPEGQLVGGGKLLTSLLLKGGVLVH